jgi:hypothetical protein
MIAAGYAHKLAVTTLLLIVGAGAWGQQNSSARVHAFGRLPDWSGLWQSAAWPVGVSGRTPGGEAQLRELLQLIRTPPYNPTWMAKYHADLQNTEAISTRNATFTACTRSFPAVMEAPWMFQLAVLPEETLLIFENGQVRHVYTNGRPHPPGDELWPSNLGDSIGHWAGNTLRIDTIARRSSEPLAPRAWFSMLSEQAHFTERLRLVDVDDMEDQLTIDDPIALAAPWRMTLRFKRISGIDRMVEFDCAENERNPVVERPAVPTHHAVDRDEGELAGRTVVVADPQALTGARRPRPRVGAVRLDPLVEGRDPPAALAPPAWTIQLFESNARWHPQNGSESIGVTHFKMLVRLYLESITKSAMQGTRIAASLSCG